MLRCSPFRAVSLLQPLLARLRLKTLQPTQTPPQLLIALLAAVLLLAAVQLLAAGPLLKAAVQLVAVPLQSAKLHKLNAQA